MGSGRAATKGNMLSRRSWEARINERTLFTGPEKRIGSSTCAIVQP